MSFKVMLLIEKYRITKSDAAHTSITHTLHCCFCVSSILLIYCGCNIVSCHCVVVVCLSLSLQQQRQLRQHSHCSFWHRSIAAAIPRLGASGLCAQAPKAAARRDARRGAGAEWSDMNYDLFQIHGEVR